MKCYKVVITEQAERDLLGGYDYILYELQDNVAAEKFYTALYKKISGLEYMPRAYEQHELWPEYRVAHALSYKIFYYIDDKNNTVVVVRVFHSKQQERL